MGEPTPGPWHVIHIPGNSRLTIHGEVYDVAITKPAGSIVTEAANARLIAAAPKMLEALLHVRDSGAIGCCCGETPCVGSCISTMVAGAIKKAREG